MNQRILSIHLANLQPRVLKPRIKPAEPRRQQSDAAQLAPVLMFQPAKIPRPDALRRFILDLDVGCGGNEIVELVLDFGPEVFRRIFRVFQFRSVEQSGFEFSAGPATSILQYGPGDVIEWVKAALQSNRVNRDE